MNEMRPAPDASREQAQFLRVLSRDEAMARFRQALDPKPLGLEHVTLAQALGRVVGDHIAAPVDVPPFDRSNVDGFALREVFLRKATQLGSRESAMLAACGIDRVQVFRKPRVAVFSTGDELIAPGNKLKPAAIYDSNGPIVAASVAENGGEAVSYGIVSDDAEAIEATLREALAECDMVVLSGGTSKGAGDLTADIVGKLGKPGIVAHGVALKPGKPLCLAVVDGKAMIVLPGFPTSAMFTFHDFIVPVLRRMSGLPTRDQSTAEAQTAVAIPSDFGRTEFAMVALSEHESGLKAFPLAKGSGAVTS